MKCVDVTYLGSIDNANQDWNIIWTYNFKQWKNTHQMKCNSLKCRMLCLKTNSRTFCSENFCPLYLWLETSFCTYWSHMNQRAKGTQNTLGKALQRYWISLPSHSGTQMLQIRRECREGLGDKVMKNPFSETFICLTSICVLFCNSPCNYGITVKY